MTKKEYQRWYYKNKRSAESIAKNRQKNDTRKEKINEGKPKRKICTNCEKRLTYGGVCSKCTSQSSAKKRYREMCKRIGKCSQCPSMELETKTLCAACAAKMRERTRSTIERARLSSTT